MAAVKPAIPAPIIAISRVGEVVVVAIVLTI